ncbi:nucleotidyltransferase family protein [Roseicella aquatilis]|uniref:Nucleotidyltransferase domain-containing protein n=1 Tax=Roseicella aquatilis TaxID=2527868 RepID=A0A4R4DGV6_9PROT|nr:nucleotidyltransferase domain-containing protein [Roseicella aquatilis]TCZ58620.1 nucleotidyltransferase domain-containing protein [Roseicella aquatilis]
MTHPVPENLLRQIVATHHPRRVILFGSHARGKAGPDSDLDRMVVLDDEAPGEDEIRESLSIIDRLATLVRAAISAP